MELNVVFLELLLTSCSQIFLERGEVWGYLKEGKRLDFMAAVNGVRVSVCGRESLTYTTTQET